MQKEELTQFTPVCPAYLLQEGLSHQSAACSQAQASDAVAHSTPALLLPLSPSSWGTLGESCVSAHTAFFLPGAPRGPHQHHRPPTVGMSKCTVSATYQEGQAQYLSAAGTWFLVMCLHCPLTSHREGTEPVQRSHSHLFLDAPWARGMTGSPVGRLLPPSRQK